MCTLYRRARMRSVVLGGFVLSIVSSVLVLGSGASAQSEPALHDLRVCGATNFSRKLQGCTTDESALSLASNRVTCSVEVDLQENANLEARMTYEGARIPFQTTPLGPGTYTRWINENLKLDRPLPGGSWTCGFTLAGTSLTASFHTDGPTGDVVNTAACRYANTVRFGSGRVCRTDESGAAIPTSARILCSATYPSAVGKLARLAIVRGGRTVASTSFTVRVPLTGAWVWARTPVGTLRGGKYACRYLLAGKLVASKPFLLDG